MKILLLSRTAAVLVVLSILSELASTNTVHGRPLIASNSNSTINTIAAGSLDYDSNEVSSSIDLMPGWASGAGITRHGFGSNITFHNPMPYPESKFNFHNDQNNNNVIADQNTNNNRLGAGRAKIVSSSTTNGKEFVYDVVIVGAGAAGMGAARRLSLSGVTNVVVLEATSGLGGRVQVNKDFTGYPLDLGASYLPGQFFKRELEQIAGRSLPVTTNLLWKNYSYNDFFTDYVAPNMDIRYNCVVIEVDYQEKNDHTRIQCADGHTFLAQYTVVTASIQILKDKDIAFTPTIDPQRYNHRDLWPGIKIFLEYDNKFYNNLFFPLPPNFDSTGENKCWDGTVSAPDRNRASNLLACYFTGNRFDNICCTPNEIKNKVETIFERYFNLQQGSLNTERYLIVDWSSKPFVKGTYSNSSNKPNFNQTVVNPGGKNTLLIAGEAYPVPGEEYGMLFNVFITGIPLSVVSTVLLQLYCISSCHLKQKKIGWVYSAFHSGFNAADQIMKLMDTRPSPIPVPGPVPGPVPVPVPEPVPVPPEPVFENLGKGYCRDATGNYNAAHWNMEQRCSSLQFCETLCEVTTQCLGISWSSRPRNNHQGCRASSKPRCVVYYGSTKVAIEKTSALTNENQEYTCYRYVEPVPTAAPRTHPQTHPLMFERIHPRTYLQMFQLIHQLIHQRMFQRMHQLRPQQRTTQLMSQRMHRPTRQQIPQLLYHH